MPIRRSPNDARHPRPQLVAIPRNRRSRSIGTAGRNQSERPVAITRCAQLPLRGGPGHRFKCIVLRIQSTRLNIP